MSDQDHLTSNLELPSSALVIAAHPDDAEFQAGATIAKWAAAGSEIHYLILTDGSKGTWDPEADTEALAAQRQREQRAAAGTLGAAGEIVFAGEIDGELTSSIDLRAEIARQIRRLRPQVVLGHDPWRRYRLHPDHREAGWLAVDGCVAARDPHFHPNDSARHHRPDHLLLFEAETVNHVEDVAGHTPTKLAALLEHRSQLRSTMHIDADDDGTQQAAFTERILDRLRRAGERAGFAEAEAFHLLDL